MFSFSQSVDISRTISACMRYGTGQLEKPDRWGTTDSVKDLRSRFLTAAGKLKPQILDDLEDQLLSTYNKIPSVCYNADRRRQKRVFANDTQRRFFLVGWAEDHRPSWYQLEEQWLDQQDVGGDPRLGKFITLMFEWSTRHNLDASWCRYHAYETLDLWSVVDDFRKARIWQLLPWDLRNRTSEIKMFRPERPEFETKIEYDLAEKLGRQLLFYPTYGGRDEILDGLKELQGKVDILVQNTKRFLTEREAAAISEGHIPSAEKSNPDHLDWFAEVQILDTPYAVLADRFHADEDQKLGRPTERHDRTKPIRRAVNAMSRLLGLPLNTRQSLKGRRPGTKIIKKNKPSKRSAI